jgi:tubulin polyglutamylase TTLL6/13
LLIEDLKFDLRIYVLIYGCDPMRIYIYEEGLARFATENYQKAKKKNMKDVCIHLTNYAINKLNKNFVFNTSDTSMDKGHKRSLTSIYSYLKQKGHDVDLIKDKINKLIVKTMIVGQPMLEHMYGLSQRDNLSNDSCFQILGFDVLLTEKM